MHSNATKYYDLQNRSMKETDRDSKSKVKIPILNKKHMVDRQNNQKLKDELFLQMGRNAFGTQFNIRKLAKESALPKSNKNHHLLMNHIFRKQRNTQKINQSFD